MNNIEAKLQNQVELYLKCHGLTFVHIPASLQRHIWSKASRVPIHIAAEASRAFKGVPDLLIFGGGGRCLIIELKAPNGTLTPEQKRWESLGMVVARSFDEAKAIIDKWVFDLK
jgi:hypothetical protein